MTDLSYLHKALLLAGLVAATELAAQARPASLAARRAGERPTAFILASAIEADPQTTSDEAPDKEDREMARQGIALLMNGDPDAAIDSFHQIQRADPQSPLGYLFEADATWWKIYLTTGNLVDPDVFDVTRASTSPYDAHFEDLVNIAIRKASRRVEAHQDEARNLLYEGMAYGLRGRFYGLRDSDLPTARAGKRMRALLLKAVGLDPNLTDAYLGLGIYNYFVDTLPTIIKLLKFLIALPSGDRETGLEQLRRAAEKGELVRDEAKFYLAKDFSRPSERQYAKSLELFQELARDYPRNMLWVLVEGSLEIRLGHAEQGEALYRRAFTSTAGMNSEVGKALHAEAGRALSRLHPNEKLQ
jgi:tetratricopeptide (TPR) repeat protein